MRLIDADDLIMKYCLHCPFPEDYNCEDSDCFINKELSKQPTIEAEPVQHGKWIYVNPMVDTLMCSECGENILGEEFKTPYCPVCGAKMDGGNESV